MTGEDRLIGWLRRQIARRGQDLLGDDAAVLPAAAPVVSVDQQIAGTHFPPDLPPAAVARRLLAVTLSDLAAMGAVPRYALLALTLAPGFSPRRFLRALLDSCEAYGLLLAGGDLARGPVAAAALTVAGRPAARGRLLHRADARVGDAIWLGGSLGGSAAGRRLVARGARLAGRGVRLPADLELPPDGRRTARQAVRRHLEPTPQLELGSWLARRPRAAAIDLSDGLALDLHRLCRASRVGAAVDADLLPLAPGLARLAALVGSSPRQLALAGGEDYVLLFTLPPGVAPPRRFAAHRIGEIVAGRRLTLREAGSSRPLRAAGWDHLAGRSSRA